MNKILSILVTVLLIQTSIYAQLSKIYDFTGSATVGKEPLGGLITDGTYLYGMTQWGGANNKGTIFKIKTDGTDYSLLYSFDNANGERPDGDLVLINNFLYGTTVEGGTNNVGVIFKIKTDGSAFAKLYDFSGDAIPGQLITDGTMLYGISHSGDGTALHQGLGFIFKLNFDGSNFSVIHVFNGNGGGSIIRGKLIKTGSVIYGIAENGGLNGNGILYKIDDSGANFSIVYQFNEQHINSIITDGIYFYGTTDFGGSSGAGSLFKVKFDGTDYQLLKDFSSVDGYEPYGNLFLNGSILYGATNGGGTTGDGNIYKINTDGTGFQTLYNCGILNYKGTKPKGSFILLNNYLYGMMQLGGNSYLGTIFKYQLTTTGINDINSNLNVSVYPNPANNLLHIQSEISYSKYFIINTLGQYIVSDTTLNNKQIDISDIPTGTYLLVLITNDKKINTCEIIIKK